MNKLIQTSVTASALLMSCYASAGIIYAIDDSSRDLLAIDSTSLTINVVGNTGVASGNFGDLAYDAVSGTMYWVAGRDNNSLYTIDLNTGAAAAVGSHGIQDQFTLGWDGSNMYGQSTSGNVYSFDTTTGAATLVGWNDVYPGGYDYNPLTGQMVLAEAGGGNFFEIDLTTGAAISLAASAGFINDNDLAFDADTNSYWVGDYSGDLYQYDATTFTRTLALAGLGNIASVEYLSAMAAPEPGILVLLGLGLAGIGLSRRKSKTV